MGEGAKVNVPCSGEHEVQLTKKGFVPFRDYFRIAKGEPLKLNVELERVSHKPDFALSTELLEQLRRGQRPHNPWVARKDSDPKEDEVETAAPAAAVSKSAAPAAGAGAGPGAASGAAATGDSPDNWR